jgi:hypothetical protein
MIAEVQVEAQKLFPALYSYELDNDLSEKIFNWGFEKGAKEYIVNFNKKYYDIDVHELLEKYFD